MLAMNMKLRFLGNVSFIELAFQNVSFDIQGVPGGKDLTSGECSLRSNYTDITQNTYIQSSMVTDILAREV